MKLNEKVRTVFLELSEKSKDGGVTPQMLVKASKRQDSLLHDQFEWDDQKAGNQYRVWQARQLLRSMTVEVEDGRVSEYENVVFKVNSHREQKYFHIDQIMENKSLKGAVVKQVQRDLKAMLDKYERYEKIYSALKKAKTDIEKAATAYA